MGKEEKCLKEIKIIPNGKGKVQLFVNGEEIDLKDAVDIHLGLTRDGNGNIGFELSTRKRVCFLGGYE